VCKLYDWVATSFTAHFLVLLMCLCVICLGIYHFEYGNVIFGTHFFLFGFVMFFFEIYLFNKVKKSEKRN